MEDSYEFNPEIFDILNETTCSLDDWKPKQKFKRLVISKWREEYNEGKIDGDASLDDVEKIKSYIKKGYGDAEIMGAFAISCETMIAIKNNSYTPGDGIQRDLDSVYNEFLNFREDMKERVTKLEHDRKVLLEYKKDTQKRIERFYRTFEFISDIMFVDPKMNRMFYRKLRIPKDDVKA